MKSEIQIIQPKKVTLLGNVNALEEKTDRNDDEKNLDYLREQSIVYPDLVFTLRQDPTQYFGPFVKYEKGRLRVIGNPIFYRAVKEAGIENIMFDLLLDIPLPLERLMELYGFQFPHRASFKDYVNRFLFFSKPIPKNIQTECSRIKLNENNNSDEYIRNNCISYSLLLHEDPETAKSFEHEFVAKLFNENGYLRSIDGLRSRTGTFGGYIK